MYKIYVDFIFWIPAAVRDDDGVHLIVFPIVDHRGHLALVLAREEHTTGTSRK